jgi:hypothetical protein
LRPNRDHGDMTDNAVANFTEAREMDRQPFLEERRQRAVDIGGLEERPQFFDEPRGRRR